MCSAKRSYHSALASAAATSFSTIGRRAASKLFNALSILASVLRAFASAIASSIASRVPEPIEKCAVRSASPINTTFPDDHRALRRFGKFRNARWSRSEEHTSELQSLAYLVCRLLLEKKKNNA